MHFKTTWRFWATLALTVAMILASTTLGMAQGYKQTNLVSDIQGLDPQNATDSQLLNPWGLTASATSPWWVADNSAGVSTLYNGNTGAKQGLVVNIPSPANGVADTPTGVVFTLPQVNVRN